MARRHKRRATHRRRRFSRRRGTMHPRSILGRGGGLWTLFGRIAPPVAFLDQLTSKNRGDFSGKDMTGKAKTLVNALTGKIMNFNIFGDAPQYRQNLNPAGIANKYTYMGIAGLVAKAVLPRVGVRIPMVGKVSTLLVKLLPAGIFGGILDDPEGYSHATYPYQVTSAANQTNPIFASPQVSRGT